MRRARVRTRAGARDAARHAHARAARGCGQLGPRCGYGGRRPGAAARVVRLRSSNTDRVHYFKDINIFAAAYDDGVNTPLYRVNLESYNFFIKVFNRLK